MSFIKITLDDIPLLCTLLEGGGARNVFKEFVYRQSSNSVISSYKSTHVTLNLSCAVCTILLHKAIRVFVCVLVRGKFDYIP